MPGRYVKRVDFRLSAAVSGKEFPVTAFHALYPLNGVPTARCDIGVGRRASRRSPAAVVPAATGQVVVSLGGSDLSGDLFSGKANGYVFRRNNNAAGFSVNLVNWLDGLRNTSAESSLFFAGVPSGFYRPPSVGDTKVATWQGAALKHKAAATASVFGGTRSMLLEAMSGPMLVSDAASLLTGIPLAQRQKGNELGAAVLRRFVEPRPLKLPLDDLNYNDQVAVGIGQVVFGGAGGPTAWDRLLTVANAYQFAIAPGVSSVEAIPFTPAYNQPLKHFTQNDYMSVDLTRNTPVSYRGAIVYGLHTAGSKDSTRPVSRVRVGSYEQEDTSGVFVTAPAPVWLDFYVNGKQQVEAIIDQGLPYRVNEMIERQGSQADDYAKAIWASAALQGRQGRLIAPFNLDVGPGSIISFDVPVGDAEVKMLGAVTGVELHADAMAPAAYTVYQLTAVRNVDDAAALSAHPLFKTGYSGRALAA